MKQINRNVIAYTIIGALLVSALAGSLTIWISNGVTGYRISKDTKDWLNRAQVASNPFDMSEYLINCRDGLNKWNITEGHWVFIFKRPANDMGLSYKAIVSMIDRCEEVKLFSVTSIEYHTALDDLRGTIRELVDSSNFNPTMTYWVNQAPGRFWYAIFGTIIWLPGWLLFFIDFDPRWDSWKGERRRKR